MNDKTPTAKWVFAHVDDTMVDLPSLPSLDELYRQSLDSREGRRRTIEAGLKDALDNLVRWEHMAKADGFEVQVFTDEHLGNPHPVFEDTKLYFVQSYGVLVRESERKGNQ